MQIIIFYFDSKRRPYNNKFIKNNMKQMMVFAILIAIAVACGPECEYCNATKCLSCSNGYYLQGNNCTICQPNCNQCQNQTSCLTCNLNYYDQNGMCYPCSQACQVCSNSVTCNKCFNSFYLLNSTCFKCAFLCVSCNEPVLCTSCIAGYYVKNGACIQCGQNCVQCLDQVGCASCSSGYYVSNGGCQACKANCQICTAISCSKCKDSYYLDENKQCVSCQSCKNVQMCNSKGQCIDSQANLEQSKSPNLILYVLIPVLGVLTFLTTTYIIVFKVIKQAQPEIPIESKGTIPTEGQIIQNKANPEQLPNQFDPKVDGDTSRQLNP